MKTLFTWLVLVCFSWNSFAAPVAIRGLGSSNEEYHGFLETQKTMKSFVQNYIESNALSDKSQKITELYEQALKYFFASSRTMAAKYFNEITSYAYDADWDSNQVSMIYQSFLKLAELYPEKNEKYVKQALNFQYDSKEEISKYLYSVFASVKKKMKIQKWDVGVYNQFDFVLVNSRTYNLRATQNILLPKAEHRITFLSNVYQPQVFRMSTEQLAVMSPPTIPIIDGTCEQPISTLEGEVVVFFNRKCILKKEGANWASFEINKKIELAPSRFEQSIADYKPPQEPFYKKTWFLVAIGVVAGVIILSGTKKDKPAPQQTETITF